MLVFTCLCLCGVYNAQWHLEILSFNCLIRRVSKCRGFMLIGGIGVQIFRKCVNNPLSLSCFARSNVVYSSWNMTRITVSSRQDNLCLQSEISTDVWKCCRYDSGWQWHTVERTTNASTHSLISRPSDGIWTNVSNEYLNSIHFTHSLHLLRSPWRLRRRLRRS